MWCIVWGAKVMLMSVGIVWFVLMCWSLGGWISICVGKSGVVLRREGIVWLHCGWFKFWVWRGGEFAVGILASGVSGWGGGVGVGGSQGGI